MTTLYKRFLNGEFEVKDMSYAEFDSLIGEWYSILKKAGGTKVPIIHTLTEHKKTSTSKKEIEMIDEWISKNS